MTYSIIGILASVILLISNLDILFRDDALTHTQRNYRRFLFGGLAYYVTDLLWGILDAQRLVMLLRVDTAIHFTAMAAAVMLWTQYVILYLESGSRFEKFLDYTGRIFFVFEAVVVVVNFFWPILFRFDEAGGYHAGMMRYVTLAIQVLMFLQTSAYTLRVTTRSEGTVKLRPFYDRSLRHRHDRADRHPDLLSADAVLCHGLHARDLRAAQLRCGG